MSNAEYFACGKCSKLMDDDSGIISCSNCGIVVERTDGSEYPYMDDDDYNGGFPRK